MKQTDILKDFIDIIHDSSKKTSKKNIVFFDYHAVITEDNAVLITCEGRLGMNFLKSLTEYCEKINRHFQIQAYDNLLEIRITTAYAKTGDIEFFEVEQDKFYKDYRERWHVIQEDSKINIEFTKEAFM